MAWQAATSTDSLMRNIDTAEDSYKKQDCVYDKLKRTEAQCEAVALIVTTLALGMTSAVCNKNKLLESGNVIYGLHPYKFLGFIISDEGLKEKFKTIFDKYSWNPARWTFLGSLNTSLDQLAANERIDYLDHIAGFALETRKDAEALRKILAEGSWETLYSYLLEE